MKTTNKTIKVNYAIIETKKSMPIAFIQNGQVKTIFRTVKQDEKGFFITMNKERQYIAKSEKAYKGITTIIIEGNNAITEKAVKTVSKKKAEKKKTVKKSPVKKAENKQPKKRVKKSIEIISNNESLFVPKMPNNLFELFTGEQVATIETIIKQNVYGYSYEHGNKVNTVKGLNSLTGEKFVQAKYNYFEAMEKLSKVATFKELQFVMVAYFMKELAQKMIWKFLQFGSSYKKLNKTSESFTMKNMSYMNAPTNNGKITQVEIEDVLHQLIIDSMTYTFSKNMFDRIEYVSTSLFFRISNIVRKEVNKNRIQNKLKQITNEGFHIDVQTSLLDEVEFLGKDEKEILKLVLQGYKYNEIDKIYGQRMDRKANRMKKALQEKAGMTLTEVRKETKQLIKKQREKFLAMKERQKEEKEALKAEMFNNEEVATISANVKRYAISSTSKMNTMKLSKALNAPKNLDGIKMDNKNVKLVHMVYSSKQLMEA